MPLVKTLISKYAFFCGFGLAQELLEYKPIRFRTKQKKDADEAAIIEKTAANHFQQ
jgi:hypothetical protein